MDSDIKHSKQELLDCIHNLMGVFDTPIARGKLNSDFIQEVRHEARNILRENNRDFGVGNFKSTIG